MIPDANDGKKCEVLQKIQYVIQIENEKRNHILIAKLKCVLEVKRKLLLNSTEQIENMIIACQQIEFASYIFIEYRGKYQFDC